MASNKRNQSSMDVSRILKSSHPPTVKEFEKILQFIQESPTASLNMSDRIESSILKLLNAEESTCRRQKSSHLHFDSHNLYENGLLYLASSCFSLLSLHKMRKKGEFSMESQLRLMYTLCETLVQLLKINDFPVSSLSCVHDHLSSKVRCYGHLHVISSNQMPFDEYLDIIVTRSEFFLLVLRNYFEQPRSYNFRFYLPTFVAIYNGFFSNNFTEFPNIPDRFYAVTSRLLHCLASVCRNLGPQLIPSAPSLLTILTHQLEWTSVWHKQTKSYEGYCRLRLGVLLCISTICSKIMNCSYVYFLKLLPRILAQLTQDLMVASELESVLDIGRCKYENASGAVSLSSLSKYKNCLLISELLLLDKLNQSSFMGHYSIYLQGTYSDCVANMSDTKMCLQMEITRLQLCLDHIITRIMSYSIGTAGFGQLPFPRRPCVLHPHILSCLAKVCCSFAVSTTSSSLRTNTINFLGQLRNYFDDPTCLIADNCYKACLSHLHTPASTSLGPSEQLLFVHTDRSVTEKFDSQEEAVQPINEAYVSTITREVGDLCVSSDGPNVAKRARQEGNPRTQSLQGLEETSSAELRTCSDNTAINDILGTFKPAFI